GQYSREAQESTISRDQFLEWTKSIWTMNAESARKVGHPAPFPEELPNRLIQLYSFRGDVILDPYMGSGTTALAALRSQRRFVGYEVNEEYVNLSNTRIETYRASLSSEAQETELIQTGRKGTRRNGARPKKPRQSGL